MRCTKQVWKKGGTTKKPDYLTASSTHCPFCYQDVVPLGEDGRPVWYKKQKPKVGLKCHKCGAELIDVEFDEAKKTKRRILFSGTDNRGNPFRVSECFGEQDYGRKGKDCQLPCLMIGGTNIQTSSARGHSIHIALSQLDDVIAALKGFER